METIGSRLIMHLLRHCNIDSKILSLVERPSPRGNRDNSELPHQIATQALFKGMNMTCIRVLLGT